MFVAKIKAIIGVARIYCSPSDPLIEQKESTL
jgi:hypothetical protein